MLTGDMVKTMINDKFVDVKCIECEKIFKIISRYPVEVFDECSCPFCDYTGKLWYQGGDHSYVGFIL